ncbi:hypothetical protein H7142_01235 [Candidatus Saccharibacteria bacterium]|nr:hypothetical protein [Candidatus Saccharibacteria bacterium]
MDNDEKMTESVGIQTFRTHQFFVLIVIVITISLFMVYVALSLYESSGTLQLDLSRPGYDSAREEAIKGNEVFRGFSSDGTIDAESLNEFDSLYKQKAAEALIDIDAFSGEALSDATLTLDRD